MRALLVPVADRPECMLALKTTFDLAKSLNANVIGCHIRAERNETQNRKRKQNWLSMGASDSDWPLLSEDEAHIASEHAYELFRKLAEQNGFPITKKPGSTQSSVGIWQEKIGTPQHIIPIVGPTSDMLVLSRPLQGGGDKARKLLMHALLSAHRPILILPQQKPITALSRIAIAWNRGSFEALTVHAILPLLKQADDVVFITVGRDAHTGPSAKDMMMFLTHHGIQARRCDVASGKDVGKTIVKTMKQEKCNLLVSGAYSRSRLHERIFGGVTQYLLTEADIPILTMHH